MIKQIFYYEYLCKDKNTKKAVEGKIEEALPKNGDRNTKTKNNRKLKKRVILEVNISFL